MNTIILAGIVNSELKTITKEKPIALLPFGSKPAFLFTIENLHEGISTNIYTHTENSIKNPLADTISELHWKNQQLCKLEHNYNSDDECLWLRDDIIYDVDFLKLLEEIKNTDQRYVAVFSDNHPIIFYKKAGAKNFRVPEFTKDFSTQDYCHKLLQAADWQTLSLKKSGQTKLIHSFKTYYQFCMDLLHNKYNYLVLDPHQKNNRLIKGWHINLNHSSQQQDHAYVGDCVYVNEDAHLHGSVILGQKSYLDQFVDITDSIVMPGVYIGPYLNIVNAIVTDTEVICVDKNIIIPIVDKQFVDAIYPNSSVKNVLA